MHLATARLPVGLGKVRGPMPGAVAVCPRAGVVWQSKLRRTTSMDGRTMTNACRPPRFRGSKIIIALINSLMGIPPVVLGLMVYLLLSRAGPLGSYGLLFTPQAMVIAQTLLVIPIIAALTRQTLADLHRDYDEQFRSFRIGPWAATLTLIWEGRYSLATAVLAGFGRASAEVGVVMIVGGNINHVTRVMTTTIAMETSKGDFSLALGLGIVLLTIVIAINSLVMLLQSREKLA